MAKTILVIDDDPDILEYLKTLLTDNGFSVMLAVNGKEGFDKAVSGRPDLITLDITMPEESGVRALKDMQENDATKDIPIIIITGVASDFKKFITTRKQVKPTADYFEKPIDRVKLIESINRILGIK